MSTPRLAVLLTALSIALAAGAAPIDPAIDDGPGPFSYFSRPSTVLGVADALQATQVTAEGWLWTGSAQLMFFAGQNLAPLRQRVRTLQDDCLPIVTATTRRGDIEYQVTMFAATLDGKPASNLINFIRVRLHNLGTTAASATFATAVRADGPGCCSRMRQPLDLLSATYSLGLGYAARDHDLLYTFPTTPAPQRFVVPDAAGEGPVSARAEAIMGTTPVCLVRYDLKLAPGAAQVLDFKFPCQPVPLADSAALAALRHASCDTYLAATAAWWNRFLARGTQIELPEAKPVATFRTSLVYDAIARYKKGDDYVPTVNRFQYHHFWVRDGSYITNAFDLTGRHLWAEQSLQHFFKCTQPNGIIYQPPQLDGFGQTLWAFGSHWRLTGDDAWARRVYPALARHVRGVFAQVAQDPLGLVPAAPPYDNEAINGHYTGHSFWLLLGMRDMIAMAQALGYNEDAAQFRQWCESYRARFLKILHQVTAKTGGYIPPGLDAKNGCDWGNLLSLYPRSGVPSRGVLDLTDPEVAKTADLLREKKYAEGLMTYGHGLHPGSLHDYLTIKCTEDLVALERQQEVLADFYSLLVHTSSTNAGFECGITPWGNRDPGGNFPPHGWFAAEYIGLLRNMLVREWDGDLHLFSVLSPAWLKPGSTLSIRQAPTDFGVISAQAQVSADKLTVRLSEQWRTPPRRLIVHLPWFLKPLSATADGQPVAIGKPMVGEGAQIALSPEAQLLTVRLQPSPLPATSYEAAVAAWKQENRRHFKAYVQAGGRPEPLWRESSLPMTHAARRENWAALQEQYGLALGCAATASASEPGHPPAAACDGSLDRSTYWSAARYPAWWQVDLGAEHLVGQVRVVTYWDSGAHGRVYQYRVQTSVDGQQWQTVADRSTNTRPATAAGDLLSFTPQRARYVRVEMLHNSANSGVHLVEVMVFPALEAPVVAAPARWQTAWTAEKQTGSRPQAMSDWGYVGAQRLVLQGRAIGESGNCVRLAFQGGAHGGITISEVSIGMTDPRNQADVQPKTRVPVSFAGHNSVDIPAGRTVTSDWIKFPLQAGHDYSVTFDVMRRGSTTLWADAKTVRFQSAATSARLSRWSDISYGTTYNLYFLSRIDVPK